MGTPTSVPFAVTLDDADSPHDAIDALIVERFVAGVHPCARTARLERVRKDASLLPAGVVATHTVVSGRRTSALAQGPGWVLSFSKWNSASADLTVVADTDDLARRVLADATRDACETRADDGGTVPVSFWHFDGRRADRSGRDVAASAWSAIRGNYTARVGSAFDQLVALDASTVSGKLLLLHGPPGTGKTTALRSLAAAWRGWCDMEVVIDAEHLFGHASYLMNVLLGERDDEPFDDENEPDCRAKRWRMLVLEDCDELLRADAKKRTGQALARLLNVTDGFLGQGLQLLVALSTNEPLSDLHPALVRPGRCMAEVHVDRLSRSEAARWAGPGYEVPAQGASLAELYAIVGAGGPVRAPELHRVSGTYL